MELDEFLKKWKQEQEQTGMKYLEENKLLDKEKILEDIYKIRKTALEQGSAGTRTAQWKRK